MTVSVKAPAKINLFLHVTGRRGDGYHELESLVAFCDVADEIVISDADAFSFQCHGPFSHLIDPADNLCIRAAGMLSQALGKSLNLTLNLRKNIPVAAGLGGGSADAAAVLRGLLKFWNVDFNPKILNQIALELGADVPVCFTSNSSIMRGIGEEITPFPLPQLCAVLINPRMEIATQAAFQRFNEPFREPNFGSKEAKDLLDVENILRGTCNQLTNAAQSLCPVIGDVLKILNVQEGCVDARMSGSGATCFGIFENQTLSDQAAAKITENHPHWWVQPVKTIC